MPLQQLQRERDDTAARLASLEPFQAGAELQLGFRAQSNLRRVAHFLVESTEAKGARYQDATIALEIAKTLIDAMEAYRADQL
jgi:hypothetical protein